MREFDNYLPLLFPIGWASVGWMIAHLGGWSALAETYRMNQHFDGKVFLWRSVGMRWGMSYGNCVNVGANSEGLYLSVQFLFRVGHPALFIPWGDITVAECKVPWFRKLVTLSFRRVPGVCVTINARLAEGLKSASNGMLDWFPPVR